MLAPLKVTTVVVSSAVPSTPIPLVDLPPPSNLAPALFITLSAGAVLTYNIEATADGVNWNSVDSTTVGLTTSNNYAFGALFVSCRVNVTAWSSGTITASLVQPASNLQNVMNFPAASVGL